MLETITPSVTEQPKVEATPQDKILERLSADFGGETVKKLETPITETKTETTPTTETTPATETEVTPPTPEEIEALKTQAKELGLPEDATKEQVAEKVKANSEWSVEEVTPSAEEEVDGSWKGIAQAFELGDLPADYSEEKGFEVIQDLFTKKLDAVREEARTESKYDRYADVPEQGRAEAELVVELMKSGQTLQQINEPFIELAQFKAMSKEELVRNALMFRYANDEEVVNSKMETLTADGKLDIEYKIAKTDLDNYEASLNAQRQEQVKNYQGKQREIQTQRFNQESAKLNHALDRVPEYLGKKLTPEVKAQLKNELVSGKYHSIEGTPEDKVDYFLYRKFGKQGIANFKARALQDVTLQNKQQQHNVPKLETGNVNRTEQTNGKSVAETRLEQQFGT